MPIKDAPFGANYSRVNYLRLGRHREQAVVNDEEAGIEQVGKSKDSPEPPKLS